ncbi:NUDIX domain-containing protein [Arthrobacter sp. M4]|uniref:NUDIX hydrolase n=1 Tax=Arthrobacter sp. M4 TaxID=218160 RepID=UPI001CDBA568|nr:NUDIX domain-containing protein [Arthrobacter sp. M4]MCA4135613.1 NUDIX domain-containing protein [Arthrobacter sp. M4]
MSSEPRLAASVILLRDGVNGPEVFVQHRVSTMDFAAGMVVFPGGRVDEVDRQAQDFPSELLRRHAEAWHLSSQNDDDGDTAAANAGTLLAAARREVFEEAGIALEPEDLLPWANWVTPPDQPKRFDTFFYIASPSPKLEPMHQTTEASSSHWMPVREILEQEAALTLRLMPPTLVLLREILGLGSVAAVRSVNRDIVPVHPAAGALQEFLRGKGLG